MTDERPSQPADPDGEAAALRRCMRDLVALSTLPAAWVHAEPLAIVESLVEVVLRILDLDLSYVRVPHAGARLEAGRTRQRSSLHGRGEELGRLLEAALDSEGRDPQRTIAAPDDGARLHLALTPVGYDRDCGWLAAASRRADFPTQHERLLLGVAANQLAQILPRKATEQLLREEAQTLETLNRVGESLAAELSLERVIQHVTDAATRVCGAQFGAFFYNVMDEKGEHYQLYCVSGVERQAFARFPMPRNTEVFAPTFAGTGIVRSDDIRKDPRYGRNAPNRGLPEGHLPVVSYLAVPVVSRSKEVLGGLFFGHARPGVFDARAERLAMGIAAQAAIAIDNARLYERLRDSAARLAEADRRKDEFLATLAHELRNPLAPLRNGLQILQLAADRPQLAESARAMMERQLEHLVRLVDDLLDVNRITTGKIDLRCECTELGAIVHNARESAAPFLERAGHALELELPPEPVYVDADPVRLAQVFCNLLSNAAKYTPPGGRIALAAARRDGAVEVSVRDTGIGISPETLPRVFDMFAQGDGPLERSHGGLGIGLTIVKRLVELHGGTVQARSDGPGKGSEFLVRLPLLELSAGRRAPAPQAVPAIRRRPRCIMVVDDNADGAASLAMLLQTMGHEVHTADDGRAALSRVRALHPDLILLDIGMPGMNGYEACRALRAQSVNARLVALSGWSQEEHRARAREAGFDSYLVKPVAAETLERLLASLPAAEPFDPAELGRS